MAHHVWPNGSRTALLVNIMYEQWSPTSAPGLGPMGNPLAPGLTDYQARSWSDYGWKTGIWRLLDTLSDAEIAATFYASGILTETAPDTIRAITAAGHELAGHAWTQDVMLAGMDEREEHAQIERCLAALTTIGGTRPRGWMSPRCTPSANTASLLAAAGFDWIGDVFDAELPYLVEKPDRAFAAFPFGLDVNDVPMNVRYGLPARELAHTFQDVASALESEDRIAYVDATFHAHVGARPAGLSALRQIIAFSKEHGFWIGTRSAALDHALAAQA